MSTAIFLGKKMKNETEIGAILFTFIPSMSPMDYCALDLLNKALYKRHLKTLDGYRKILVEEGSKINLNITKILFLCWNILCNLIFQQKNCQTNHVGNKILIFGSTTFLFKIITKLCEDPLYSYDSSV